MRWHAYSIWLNVPEHSNSKEAKAVDILKYKVVIGLLLSWTCFRINSNPRFPDDFSKGRTDIQVFSISDVFIICEVMSLKTRRNSLYVCRSDWITWTRPRLCGRGARKLRTLNSAHRSTADIIRDVTTKEVTLFKNYSTRNYCMFTWI